MPKQTTKQIRNNRKRGKYFEARIAELITLSLQSVNLPIKDRDIVRTPMSGSLAVGSCGDITKESPAAKKAFPWTVECKNQKDFPSLEMILGCKKGRYAKFQKCWDQAVDQSVESTNKNGLVELPLLIWKIEKSGLFLCAFSDYVPQGVQAKYMHDAFNKFAYENKILISSFDYFLLSIAKLSKAWFNKDISLIEYVGFLCKRIRPVMVLPKKNDKG